ncbi:DUF4870 domain-containing protein [Stenotrophomonas maltophilia]|uniref:DUF4870 domain-containing protein n=1 Tax=Lysobacteraceae TaxID=32033 RepID=UPI000776E751|nr:MULTISPECIES: DUF4870 domain-containing protein [Xanthomonadaceae]KXU95461.1 membrane protein [Stenotrophomonas sp. DDT-1]MBA0225646.1 DUF4870 domain-containing protein [Stenotrophomonas maltophilia]MBA0365978.1 DUF4870 domain-containing protein [Stenotrophomonas maltophilia]MBA0403610.1 DUF4870 domain-containing protein [Stenotrophomonas maltophilia]MCF3520544.1 DUF4870 domain-containing protein [Stenotrophomonas maltophilia]
MSEFDNVPPPPATTNAPADQRTMALAAHLLGIFTGFIGALIIWLINKDDAGKGFVTDQSKEALNFQITVAIAVLVCVVLSFVVIGAILMPIVYVANLVLCIIAAVKANNGEAYRYPFALRLVK